MLSQSNKQRSSQNTALIKFYIFLGVIHCAEAQSMNIGNLLKSCSLSHLYNLLCQWFSSAVLL